MGRKLDPRKLTIIAEIGEHPHQWPEMLKLARWAGADAVKVQLWRASHFPKGEKTRSDEFPREQFREFVQVARGWGMLAGASVFDAAAVWLGSCGDFLKLATREDRNPFLFWWAALVARAFRVPLFQSVNLKEPAWINGLVIPLGCIPNYPTSAVEAGIYMADWFRWFAPVKGWSSHTSWFFDCELAAMNGATVIEKHLCRGKNRNAWSLLPHEFKEMVDALKEIN